ncbi:MAG TPA: adenylate/guanylate cyclase domain-containing protein, partial [Actinomycetota bacterium]|nr:adenylate/guanylate cyclase domain-containing protein [Actinomycetota bacterium]
LMGVRRLDRVGGTATILVTDLVGSTAMFDRLGDEKAERLLRAHLGELRDLVRSFGGVEVKSTGDGIMAAFPAAWLATECAVAMQRSSHLRNEGGGDEPLHIRIGLHSGDTTADRHDYYGIAVAVAARLCDQAPPDGILVSGVTRGLVGSRGGHSFTDAGIPALKGIDEPVQAWALEWGPGQLPPATPPGLERRRGPLIAAAAGVLLVAGVGAGMLFAGEEEPRRGVRLQAPGKIVRISVKGGYDNPAINGDETTDPSFAPAISGDGSTVVFVSEAADLVPDDANGETADVFHVAVDGTAVDHETLAIVSRDGEVQASGPSREPAVSTDGSVVGFVSTARNLEPSPDGRSHVFVHDVTDGTTTMASINRRDEPANAPSADIDVSADGSHVAFASRADNLSRFRDTNDVADIFVRDLAEGRTNRVNIRSGNRKQANARSHSPSLSADGRWVAFSSAANSLTPRDTNNSQDVFRFDRDPDEFKTVRASVTSEGELTDADSYDPSISDDGTRVAFVSEAPDLADADGDEDPDVFVHDFESGETLLVSAPVDGEASRGDSLRPVISGNGRFVAFDSSSDDLVPNDRNGVRDIFVFEIETGEMIRVSLTDEDEEAALDSFAPSISDDGSFVVFTSGDGLVGDDINRRSDVYLRGPLTG